MSTTINIHISDNAAKWIVGGACFLGALYLFYQFIENMPEEQITLPAESKKFSELPQLSPSTFDELNFHPAVKESARAAFTAEDYTGAVRAASITLYDIIRKKSGVQEDATTLITKAFRGKKPILKFVDLAEPHITNAEDGMIGMLEGFSKSIRKIHMHSNAPISESTALKEISLVCYLAEAVDKHAVLQKYLEMAD